MLHALFLLKGKRRAYFLRRIKSDHSPRTIAIIKAKSICPIAIDTCPKRSIGGKRKQVTRKVSQKEISPIVREAKNDTRVLISIL